MACQFMGCTKPPFDSTDRGAKFEEPASLYQPARTTPARFPLNLHLRSLLQLEAARKKSPTESSKSRPTITRQEWSHALISYRRA
jgi:hypothetical protein